MYITNPPLSNKKLGGFGRVLSIFGRKKDSISSDGRSSERASFMDVMDVDSTYDQQGDSDGEVSRLDEVIDENSTSDAFKVYHSLLDSDFKELHKKEVDLRTNLLREDKVKLLEQKETNLESRLKELELRQIQLVSEQLKGQLKELQIRELKLLEKKVNKEKEEEEKERRRQMSIESEKGYEKDTLIRVLGSRSKSNSPKPDMNKSLPVISPVLQSENVVVKVEANRDKSLPDIVQDKSLLETKLNSIDSIREDDDEGGDILPTSKNTEERWTSDTTGLGIDILSSSGLREPRLDYVTSSSSILNRSGSGNKFGNLHAFQNESFEDLPEPQIYDTPDESFGSDNPLNVLNDTLQTFTSEGGKFDVFHPRSRILSESSGKAGSSKSDNSEATKTNTIAVGVSTSTPISKSVVTIPIPSTTPISSNTISNISFSSTESRKRREKIEQTSLSIHFKRRINEIILRLRYTTTFRIPKRVRMMMMMMKSLL